MNNIVPAVNRPDDSDADASHAEQHARGRSESRRRRTTGVPTREECLRKLAQLPGLVAMKIISPAESNAISRSLQVILAEIAHVPVDQDRPRGERANTASAARPAGSAGAA